MTIALAVCKGGRTVLAADSLVHFGGQRFPESNCRFSKIYSIGESAMAWSGWSLYAELFSAHLAASPPPALSTEAEVFDFFLRFWRTIKEEYDFKSRADDEPFANLDSVFLLVNRAGIFRIAGNMDVTQFKQYCAVGTGSRYSLGALRVLYDQMDDPVEIARKAVQVAIDFDVYCDGSVDVMEVR